MKDRYKKFALLAIFLLFLGSWVFSIYLLNQNQELLNEVSKRNDLITDAKARDSIFTSNTKMYADTIEKYINNCELTINGKRITINEFLEILNKTYKENSTLKDSINNLNDKLHNYKSQVISLLDTAFVYKNIALTAQRKLNTTFKVDKAEKGYIIREDSKGIDSIFVNKQITEFIKRDFGLTYNVEKKGDSYIFQRNPSIADSAYIFKKLIELSKKYYNLDYKIENGKDVIYYSVQSPTIDSALVLFPYFKHMLTENKDKKGWQINISGKKIREARRFKVN